MPPRGKTTQLHNMYVADFETCDMYENDNSETPKQKVWFAGFKNLETYESTYFNNLSDFMQAILSRGDNTNTEYAFHNIKFDGSFIIPYLYSIGYIASISKPKPGEFSVLVDNRNAWYTITIQVTKRRKVTLWDSAKLFPCQLAYLHNVHATPTKKIKEDQGWYKEFRPDDYTPNGRDLQYFENDLQVPCETLNKHIEMYGLRFKKTQASQSFYNFEQSFKAWKWRFPPLSIEHDSTIRQAYWGGISHVPKNKACHDHYNINSMDINSSYPHKLAECKLPYGDVCEEYGEGKHPNMSKFWVAEAICTFKLKKDCLPCIPSKALVEGKEKDSDKWLSDSNGVVILQFSCIDYKTIQQSYKLEIIEWCWSIHWKWKKHKEIATFIYKNNEMKVKYSKLAKQCLDETKKAGYLALRNRYKIDNNSFYGKFGEALIRESKTPYLSEDEESIVWKTDKKEVLTEYKRKFLPIAIAITAWGRQQLVTLANILGEHFLYCDTDSVHYLASGHCKVVEAAKQGIIEIDGEKLGAWSFEGFYVKGRYLRAKAYMEEKEDGTQEVTLAGLPADSGTGQFSKTRSCITWDNFKFGTVIDEDHSNKLRTITTATGNKLVPTHFTIKEKIKLFEH